jgi:hypothetical protein
MPKPLACALLRGSLLLLIHPQDFEDEYDGRKLTADGVRSNQSAIQTTLQLFNALAPAKRRRVNSSTRQ